MTEEKRELIKMLAKESLTKKWDIGENEITDPCPFCYNAYFNLEKKRMGKGEIYLNKCKCCLCPRIVCNTTGASLFFEIIRRTRYFQKTFPIPFSKLIKDSDKSGVNLMKKVLRQLGREGKLTDELINEIKEYMFDHLKL